MTLSALGRQTGSPPSETAGIVFDALAPNTRRAYERSLRQFNDWLAGRPANDASLAAWLVHRFDLGAAPSTLKQATAAVKWFARATGMECPAGLRTAATLKMISEIGRDRGRGQASPITLDDAAVMVRLAPRPVDAAIVALLFQGALRRSEVAALRWRDVEPLAEGAALVHVRSSKTNRDGSATDVRYLKAVFARAVLNLRSLDARETDPVIGLSPPSVNLRFKACATAAGVEGKRLSAHSGRVGLASELTARGATVTEVMLAGAWKSERMVAHYSAGARAEKGAVAKYMCSG